MGHARLNRSAQIRDYLAKGFAPQAIARILNVRVNHVHVTAHYMKAPRRRTNRPKRSEQMIEPTKPVTVGADKLSQRLSTFLPDGYDRDPRSRDVDWGAAIVWMRKNPPPHMRSAMP